MKAKLLSFSFAGFRLLRGLGLEPRLEVHLRLDDKRDELLALGRDARLPDLGSSAAMDDGRAADHDRVNKRAADEVGLALDRRRPPGVGGEIDEGGRGPERVGEAHDRPAMGDPARRAELRPDQHLRGEGIRLRAQELDPEHLRERQRIGFDAVDQRHAPPPLGTLRALAVSRVPA
jgi:hypothetical protein